MHFYELASNTHHGVVAIGTRIGGQYIYAPYAFMHESGD